MRNLLMLMLLLSLILSCEKDPSSPDDMDKPLTLDGVYIVNEGNFGKANATLSYLNVNENEVYNEIYKKTNGEGLGDVAQSMTIVDSLGYIVVNNSDKIVIISLNTWKKKGVIELPAGSSPRYMQVGDDNRAYVTNLYTNNVAIIDLSDNSIRGYIAVGNNPEQMGKAEGKVYVANSGFGSGNTVSVINISDNSLIKTLTVGDNPRFIQVSSQGEIHILCSGSYGDWNDPNDDTDGGVYVVDPNSDTVVDTLIIKGHPSALALNGHSSGYYLSNGYIVSYDTETRQTLNDTLIRGYFYQLAVDKSNDLIFALDAKDFQQNGELRIYDSKGELKYSYTMSIIPGFAAFKYKN